MSNPFDPALATKIATEMAEDDERALSGPWFSGADPSHFDAPEITDRKTFAWYIGTDATAAAIARLRNNARSAAEQLRAAVAEADELTKVYNITFEAGEYAVAPASEKVRAIVADRDRLAARVADLRAGKCLGVIPDTFTACGEGGNFCSEACRLAARVKELEALAGEACDIADIGLRHEGPATFGAPDTRAARMRDLRRIRSRLGGE